MHALRVNGSDLSTERERMRASLRWKNFILGGLLLMPGAAIAQSTPDPAPSSPPAADSVGPQELQNFSLSGKVTKPADQQPAPAAAPASPASSDASNTTTAPSAAPARNHERIAQSRQGDAKRPVAVPASTVAAKPAAELANDSFTQAPGAPPPASPTQAPAVGFPSQGTAFPAPSIPAAESALGSEHRLLIWPWLVAALAAAGGAFFLLWRRRQQSAFAGRAQFDHFVAPEPAPAPPQPAPAPPRATVPVRPPEPAKVPPRPTKPASSGIVSTRLRPSLEVDARPVRCLVEAERVVLEFELELFNSGTAPARAVLAEASLFNAGANQEQELAAFFANPVGAGERLDSIPPMKRITFMNQVVAPREAIQEYELGGRKVFVPVLAFNALYTWSGGEAQTSTAYLVGRDTTGAKLGPLSLDGGPRQIGKLAARPLPTGMRT